MRTIISATAFGRHCGRPSARGIPCNRRSRTAARRRAGAGWRSSWPSVIAGARLVADAPGAEVPRAGACRRPCRRPSTLRVGGGGLDSAPPVNSARSPAIARGEVGVAGVAGDRRVERRLVAIEARDGVAERAGVAREALWARRYSQDQIGRRVVAVVDRGRASSPSVMPPRRHAPSSPARIRADRLRHRDLAIEPFRAGIDPRQQRRGGERLK